MARMPVVTTAAPFTWPTRVDSWRLEVTVETGRDEKLISRLTWK